VILGRITTGDHELSWKAETMPILIEHQVNLLIIDPFPPGTHDPRGVVGAVLDEFTNQQFELPPDKPLTLAAYQVEPIKTAYVETIACGDRLPDMPRLTAC